MPLADSGHRLTIINVAAEVTTVLIYGAVGVVVVRHQPRNAVGWILLTAVVLLMPGTDAGYYAVLHYRLGHRGLPLAPVAVLLDPLWVPAVALFPLVILLFPDGRLVSRRWRWLLWAYGGLVACVMAIVITPTVAAVAGHDIHLDSFGDVTNPGHPASAAT